MDAVLTGKGISVAYQQNIIIPSMDVEISRGCVTSVIGPNGCGKSTLLKALSRMLPVRSGQVLLDGGMIARMPAAEVAKQMAILPQGPQKQLLIILITISCCLDVILISLGMHNPL